MNNEEEKVVVEDLENNIENTNIVDDFTEEAVATTEEVVEVKEVKKPGVMAHLGSNIIDQCICLIISMALVFAVAFILPFAGYRVANTAMVMVAVYIVVNILYTTIMESSKSGKTFGKKIFK